RASGEREERAYLLGGVHPDFRRRGIGTSLFGWQLGRATEQLRATGNGLPRFVRTQAYDFETSAIALYERHGLLPIRYQDELLRPLEHPSPSVSVEGIEISGWEPPRSEEARAVYNEAFADHWGSTPRDRKSWDHHLTSTGIRLDLSFIATDAGRLVGLALNAHYPDDQALTGRRDGWIFQLAVLRSHRRRGIASALIGASLEAFRQAGFTHAALGVDSENPTGAYRLYEGLGFRRMTRSIVHQLQV
ncbi:MAG TPA: GNAT family N-acetyltransferase, partial [Acidimicrobiia bacterium]|nr:GNAT family N-acetyltransferase [Acidimicrobiia bacterium]